MTTQHTPGPWVEVDGRIFPDGYVLTGAPIATIHSRKKEGMQKANARLIAAAPDLLEALTAFLRAPSVGSDCTGSVTIVVQSFNLKAARAAIAKVEGGAT